MQEPLFTESDKKKACNHMNLGGFDCRLAGVLNLYTNQY
jgi:hypothetical protein